MKKFFSLVLALVMALSLTTVAWGAIDSQANLEAAIPSGGEVILDTDITLSSTLIITNGVTLNLNGKTITGEIEINTTEAVTIKNGSITNAAAGGAGRCIDTRVNANVTIDGVALTTTGSGNTQPLTIGGSTHGTTIVLKNSTIAASQAGYAIISFVKTNLTIQNCNNISGYAAIYMKPGSNGSVVNIEKSTLISNGIAGASNSFSTVVTEDDNVTFNVDKDSTLTATAADAATEQAIFGLGTEAGNPDVSNVKINVADGAVLTGQILAADAENVANNTVTVPAEYADELVADVAADGYTVLVTTDGTAVIVPAVTMGDKFDLYLADSGMATALKLGAEDVSGLSFNEVNAKTNQDGSGRVAYIAANNGQFFVKTTAPTTTSYAVTYAGKTDVLYYVNLGPAGAGYYEYSDTCDIVTEFGVKCGQCAFTNTAYTANPLKTYFLLADEETVCESKAAVADPQYNFLVNGVVYSGTIVGKVVDHSFTANDFDYNATLKQNVPTSTICTKCLMVSTSIYLDGKVPAGKAFYDIANATAYSVVAEAAAGTVVTPDTDKVQSAETFDVGIAMYVGMSVMAAAGSVVVLKKRED